MTNQSRELALCLINENTDAFPYSRRCNLARETNALYLAELWARETARYAHHYKKEQPGSEFTTADVLLAAAEVADYYQEHLKEIDAA